MTIIGVHGKKNAGKDTVFHRIDYLVGARRVSFADKLKEFVANVFGITLEQIEAWKNDPAITVSINDDNLFDVVTSHTFRSHLERVGTEGGRMTFGYDFWVQRCNLEHAVGDTIVIPDVRFDNEAERIRSEGGKIIAIAGWDGPGSGHESDDGISPWLVDYEVDNDNHDDGFASLDEQLQVILNEIGIPC